MVDQHVSFGSTYLDLDAINSSLSNWLTALSLCVWGA